MDFSHLANDDHIREAAAADMAPLLLELAARRRESLKLWEPLEVQERFHASRCRVRLLRAGNRSGKTLTAAVEMARAVTGQDPHRKYPKRGDAYVVGKSLKHLGLVIYPYLFGNDNGRPFWVISDKRTGLWRAFRPWSPEDVARKQERKSAPPLIPARFVDKVVWSKAGKGEPEMVRLKTGWTVWFFSGNSVPPQGSAADLIWFDEEIENRLWFPEMNFRIVDRGGRIVWTATPQNGTEQFYNLHEQAEEDAHRPPPERRCEEFKWSMTMNPHISAEDRLAAEAGCVTEEDRLVRIEGEFALSAEIVWPEYNRQAHGIVPAEGVPNSWTRYAVIDPGHQVCAVLFAACPDPADVRADPFDVLVYDELYIYKSSAEKFADAFALKVGSAPFESFIIDTRGSRVTEAGSGLTIFDQYKKSLAARGVKSRLTGSGFAWGSDLVKDGIEMVRQYLKPDKDGKLRLRFACRPRANGSLDTCLPNFEEEIARYRFKRDPQTNLVTNEPETRGRVHLMSCTRYLCMARPRHVRPKAGGALPTFAARLLEQDRERARRGGPRITHFGPAGVTP